MDNGWILPNGDMINLSFGETHEDYAQESGFIDEVDAMSSGWIRVATCIGLNVDTNGCPTHEAIKCLRDLIKTRIKHGLRLCIVNADSSIESYELAGTYIEALKLISKLRTTS